MYIIIISSSSISNSSIINIIVTSVSLSAHYSSLV